MSHLDTRCAVTALSSCILLATAVPRCSAEGTERAAGGISWGKVASGLSCSLRTDKLDYTVGEDILLDVFLRNESDEIVTVVRPVILTSYNAPFFVSVEVTGPRGRCQFRGPMHSRPLPMPKSNYIALQRGEVVGASGLANGLPRIVPKYWSMLEPGVYTIRFRFARSRNWYWDADQTKEMPFTAWTGDLTSNPVQVRVAPMEREGR
jgi:hypothetical protein